MNINRLSGRTKAFDRRRHRQRSGIQHQLLELRALATDLRCGDVRIVAGYSEASLRRYALSAARQIAIVRVQPK